MSESTTWLTQEAFDRLNEELNHLTNVGRVEIAERIEAAREEGDLKENGGYHAARDEQAKMEARIRQLQGVLTNAKVGEAPADDGVVEPGMVVTAEVGGDEMTFLLGSREVGPTEELEVFSERSPLGQAILGMTPGKKVSYTAPNGKSVSVKIIDAKPYRS